MSAAEQLKPVTAHHAAHLCAGQVKRLSNRERVSLDDIVSQLVWDGTVTEKQSAWLRTIYVRLRREVGQ